MTYRRKAPEGMSRWSARMAGRGPRIRLRLIVLCLAFVLSAAATWDYLAKAEPAKESATLEHNAPVILNVYSSDLTTSVTLTAVVQPPPIQDATVYLSVKDPQENANTTILVTSNVNPTEKFQRVNLYTGYYHRDVDRGIYVGYFSANIFNRETTPGIPGTILASFRVNSVEQPDGSFFAHLPALETDDSANSEVPPNQVPPPLMTDPKGLLAYPVEKGVQYPDITKSGKVSHKSRSYQGLSAGPHELYWLPVSVSTEEELYYVGSTLRSTHIDSMFPPDGKLVGQSLVWHTSGTLEPTVSAANVDSLASQTHYAFLSGILIGVVISAAFALVAELPEAIRRPRFRRR